MASPPHSDENANPAASMSLLTTILDSALDPGYQRAAAELNSKDVPRWRQVLHTLLIVALVAGAIFAVKALRFTESEISATRANLVNQVDERYRQVTALEAEIGESQHLLEEAEEGSAAAANGEKATPAIEIPAAQLAASGPGVRVTLTESEALAPQERGFVTDGQLRAVVNVLWSAGAEAISINGSRLGPASTVRTAGSAILVDLNAVVSPYEIEAIGDSADLLKAVSTSATGEALTQMSNEAGYRMSFASENQLELAGTSTVHFSHAHPEETP